MRTRHRHYRARKPATLSMTSLMDILTTLLLFLLKSFVAEPEVVTPAAGVNLPYSTSQDAPQESIVVAILGDQISLGNEVIAQLDVNSKGDLMIRPLATALSGARLRHDQWQQMRGSDAHDAPMRVTIQGDRTMPFLLLQRVMYTCNQSGFDDISLAVLRNS